MSERSKIKMTASGIEDFKCSHAMTTCLNGKLMLHSSLTQLY